MFHCRSCTTILVVVVAVMAVGLHQSVPKMGWLDRLVQYHKERFINKLRRTKPFTGTNSVPPNFNATLITKPEGFVDSNKWNFESVARLMFLLKSSEAAKPTHRALRRMLQPTRRIMMSIKESVQRFPGLQSGNNIYYDIEYSGEDEAEPKPQPLPEDQMVVVITNPVEARLPSSRITVQLLREILEARARAARQMPPTTPYIIPWKPMNKTKPIRATTETGNRIVPDDTKTANMTTTEASSTITTAATTTTTTTTPAPEPKL